MKRRLALALFLLTMVACYGPPGRVVDGEGGGTWSYATGPGGEECLFYRDGSVSAEGWGAMDCKWPEE